MKTKHLLTSILCASFLLGCGGGGGSSSTSSNTSTSVTTSTAYLTDANVEGIRYICGTLSGLTGSDGSFLYQSNCTTTFSVGSVTIGSIAPSSINADTKVYPSDLAGVERSNTSNATVKKIAVFLQSIDSDGNPYNGISISQDARDGFTTSRNLSTDAVSTILSDAPSTLNFVEVNENQAIAHLENTLNTNLSLGLNSVGAGLPLIKLVNTANSSLYKHNSNTFSALTNTTSTNITVVGPANSPVYVDNVLKGTISANHEFTTSLDTSSLTTEGASKTFSIKLSDTASLQDTLSFTLKRDTTAPTLALNRTAITTQEFSFNTLATASMTDAHDKTILSLDTTNDSTSFLMDTSGNISFKSLVSFESPLDADANNVYTATIKASDGLNSSSQNIQVTVLDKRPIVIIRVQFSNYTFNSSSAVWAQKIFGTNTGELGHYFNTISNNGFELTPATETYGSVNDGFIDITLSQTHPGNSGFNATHLVSALSAANSYIDFASYDQNSNGYIEASELQIMFLVAGGESAIGQSPGIWAHKSAFSTGPLFDGVRLMQHPYGNYARFGELHDLSTKRDATIGIIAHELGHSALNLPDLYDTDNSSEGIGYWGLMGAGSWGYKGNESPGATPVHMSAWSKIKSGFQSPTVITTNQNNVALRGTSLSNSQILKLQTTNQKEYFLLENRQAGNYDSGLYRLSRSAFNGGLAIWHIDESQSNNDNEQRKLVDLEEASTSVSNLDNVNNIGHRTNLFYAGNKTDFTDSTSPNSKLYSGSSSNISITNTSSSQNTMYVDVQVP